MVAEERHPAAGLEFPSLVVVGIWAIRRSPKGPLDQIVTTDGQFSSWNNDVRFSYYTSVESLRKDFSILSKCIQFKPQVKIVVLVMLIIIGIRPMDPESFLLTFSRL